MEWLRGWLYLLYEMLFQRITASHLQNPLPLPPLNDLTCIITGSTSGIGLEVAKYVTFHPFLFPFHLSWSWVFCDLLSILVWWVIFIFYLIFWVGFGSSFFGVLVSFLPMVWLVYIDYGWSVLFVIWVSVDGVPFAYFSSLDGGFLSYICSSSDKIAVSMWVRWNNFVVALRDFGCFKYYLVFWMASPVIRLL